MSLPYIIFYYIKVIRQLMFYGKFAKEGDSLVDNPNVYNVMSHGLQLLTTGSVLKIRTFL